MNRRRRPGFAAAVAVAALAAGACVEPEQPSYDYGSAPSPDDVPAVAELAIDAGGELPLTAGDGVAVAVEYAGEGRWSLVASCDTTHTGLSCVYDLVLSTDESSPITGIEGVELEDTDRVSALDAFAVSGEFRTTDDLDGFGFTTSPGATVRVSALLYDPQGGWDWSEDPRMITWVGHGGIHSGAPTNPVDLTPDRP